MPWTELTAQDVEHFATELATTARSQRDAVAGRAARPPQPVASPEELAARARELGLTREVVLLAGSAGWQGQLTGDEALVTEWPPEGLLAARDLSWVLDTGPAGPQLLLLG